jgi:type IV secretory pathway VirB3-like protein/rRNA maturation protein Nop10
MGQTQSATSDVKDPEPTSWVGGRSAVAVYEFLDAKVFTSKHSELLTILLTTGSIVISTRSDLMPNYKFKGVTVDANLLGVVTIISAANLSKSHVVILVPQILYILIQVADYVNFRLLIDNYDSVKRVLCTKSIRILGVKSNTFGYPLMYSHSLSQREFMMAILKGFTADQLEQLHDCGIRFDYDHMKSYYDNNHSDPHRDKMIKQFLSKQVQKTLMESLGTNNLRATDPDAICMIHPELFSPADHYIESNLMMICIDLFIRKYGYERMGEIIEMTRKERPMVWSKLFDTVLEQIYPQLDGTLDAVSFVIEWCDTTTICHQTSGVQFLRAFLGKPTPRANILNKTKYGFIDLAQFNGQKITWSDLSEVFSSVCVVDQDWLSYVSESIAYMYGTTLASEMFADDNFGHVQTLLQMPNNNFLELLFNNAIELVNPTKFINNSIIFHAVDVIDNDTLYTMTLDQCPICLDPLHVDLQLLAQIECKHVYHLACIGSWVQKTDPATCPKCRSDMWDESDAQEPEVLDIAPQDQVIEDNGSWEDVDSNDNTDSAQSTD